MAARTNSGRRNDGGGGSSVDAESEFHVDGFSAAQCAALLRAIAEHDQVDRAAALPSALHLDYDTSLLRRSYRLSHQLWTEVDRGELAGLATTLLHDGRLGTDALRAFKDIRARAKQLRFASAMLDERHRYPVRLDRLTRHMGQAQDAARGGRRVRARVRGVMLRALVSRRSWAALLREVDDFRPAPPAGVRDHVLRSLVPVRDAVDGGMLTNRSFHDVRKVVSRLVAFYDTLTVLDPGSYHRSVDRYLATIIGLMGGAHDVMAERKAQNRRAYRREAEPLPAEIAERLRALAAAFLPAEAVIAGGPARAGEPWAG
jgi:hypothetical protein